MNPDSGLSCEIGNNARNLFGLPSFREAPVASPSRLVSSCHVCTVGPRLDVLTVIPSGRESIAMAPHQRGQPRPRK